MPLLRTSVIALAVGGAAVTTGVVATSATAAPAPVAAVTAAVPAAADSGTATSTPAVRGKVRAWWAALSETQQQCLKDANLRRPVGPLDDAQRAAVRSEVEAAAKSCGVELPFAKARAFWNGLTDAQRQCLRDADVTRPIGPMTEAERRQVRQDLAAAASTCGVTLPERPAPATTPAPSTTGSAFSL